MKYTFIDSCFQTHHLQFGFDDHDNSSPGDLAPVFDAILENAHRLCGVTLGSLMLSDGKRLRAVATHGYPEEFGARAREGGPTHMFTSFERLLRGERFVHIADASLLTTGAPMTRAGIEAAGIPDSEIYSISKSRCG